MSHLVLLHKLPCYHLSIPSPPPSSSSSSSSSELMIKSRVKMFPYSVPELHPIKTNNRILIKCMANPRRVAMVAKQIWREISTMLLTDTKLQSAILPEVALGADRYLSSVTTITDVEISNDLQVAKVYVSVFGDDRGREVALSGLKAKTKYVRGKLGKQMRLRITPEIRFIEDDSLERGSRVIAILDKIKSDNDKKNEDFPEEKEETANSLDDDDDDDDNWGGDDDDDDNWGGNDTDEGVIYVR